MENFDDTFLARWIAGETSPDEDSAFKSHPDFKKYEQIKLASDALSFTEFNEDIAFEHLKTKLKTPKTKIIPLYTWIASIAACAVIAIGFFFFNSQNTTYTSTIAQQNQVNLPDGSIMILNASAEAKINTKSWNENRVVFLEGEAFFKVKKGVKFTVKTDLGSVEVLGTQFTVNTVNKDLITVKCFEGKVKVISSSGEALLTKGMAYQDHNNTVEEWGFTGLTPNWLSSKETSLHKVPVAEVITLLKRQYTLTIHEQERIDNSLLFTGNFSNTDLAKALYSVFGTLGVSYELITKNEIRILSE